MTPPALSDDAPVSACTVSVIMLTMSRPQYLDAAIESVRQQSFPAWELIIVHDGTDPRIAPVVRLWVERDPRIRYFHRPVPGNIADGMNYGIAQGRGRYIAVLDDDDAWIHPEKLRLQVGRLEQDPGLVAVGGGAVVVDGDGREKMRYLKPSEPGECSRRALFANPLIHSSVLYRKSAAEAVAGYDRHLAEYADWDFCLKLMRFGAVANLPEYFATYRIWPGGSSSRHRRTARSAMVIINRHGGYFLGHKLALLAGACHLAYSYLPAWMQRCSDQRLSRLKKRLFSVSGRGKAK
jgi:glycosyltransferase involved in cell wall biosynthesis